MVAELVKFDLIHETSVNLKLLFDYTPDMDISNEKKLVGTDCLQKSF
jgi:hypothetical protein